MKCPQTLKLLRFIASIALVLALFVVMLGAYTRLTDAGLGCPDWPGCYGHMVLPSLKNKLSDAQKNYPQNPIESRKAWTEMAHRYAAGTLALLILIIGVLAIRCRQQNILLPRTFPLALLLLVIFQAILGMWTVTLKLLPVVVMGHLLGGMLIFASLCYFRMQISTATTVDAFRWRCWIVLGIMIVFCQIALGGWVSSNYAGIACVGFPRCNGEWLPTLHFAKGFNLFAAIGENYQGGTLENKVRITLQFIHRVGAFVAASYVLVLSLLLIRSHIKSLRKAALLSISVVVLQFALGIANVVYLLPLWVAVAHNGTAALLLGVMFVMHYLATKGVVYAR